MNDRELMEKIHRLLGEAIRETVHTSSVPEAFLAAIIANESGGNVQALRFEPDVFKQLCLVLAGKKAAYEPRGVHHPLGRNELLPFVDPSAFGGPTIEGAFAGALQRVAGLSTSYGVTQIMGWHALEFSKPFSSLTNLREHLKFAVFLLTYFANRYQLDLTSEFDELLHCWNAGDPAAATHDPEYVPNARKRMELYKEILAAALAPGAAQP